MYRHVGEKQVMMIINLHIDDKRDGRTLKSRFAAESCRASINVFPESDRLLTLSQERRDANQKPVHHPEGNTGGTKTHSKRTQL